MTGLAREQSETMKLRETILLAGLWALASGCGLMIAPTLGSKVSDEMEQRFEVAGGGTLRMEVDRGSIEVIAGEGDAVLVRVSRVAEGRRSQAQDWLKRHRISMSKDGIDVRVNSKFEGSVKRLFRRSPRLQVKYEVTVPRDYSTALRTAGGRVKVGGLTGSIRASTAGGGMEFTDIRGPIQGQTSGGGITVATCNGTVKVETAGGGIRLSEIAGDVTAHTSGGSIHLDGVRGNAMVETAGGGIDAKEVEGELTARTSGGSIRAILARQPLGNQTLKTSGGGITVQLPSDARFDVDARTSGGRVMSDFPVASVQKSSAAKHLLKGKINGGGVLISAETSGGSIHFEEIVERQTRRQ